MEKSKRMVAVIALIPLLLMVAGGLAVSHWDDEVQVTGSVAMGSFNIQMSLKDAWDNESTYDVGHYFANLYTVNDVDDAYDGGVNDGLNFTLTNVYPGYEACVIFDVHNAGTIPANLTSHNMIFNSTFDMSTYAKYLKVELYYIVNSTTNVLLGYLDDSGNWHTVYNYATDPQGITTLNVGETQYYQLCIGLESQPVNAPESLMDQSFSFAYTMTWLQAVP